MAELEAQKKTWQQVVEHPLVKELLARFQPDIIKKEFIPHRDWLDRFTGNEAAPAPQIAKQSP